MDILIRFIGIVTMACLGDDPSNACKGNIPMRAYLPNAKDGAIICEKHIHSHKAYIRISQQHTAMNWTPLSCEPKVGNECSLYPLDGDEIFIEEVSKGSGVDYSGRRPREISWRSYYPDILLDEDLAESRSAAFIDLNAGKLRMAKLKKMWVGHLALGPLPQDVVIIEARGQNGITTRSIRVTAASSVTIDIINLPKKIAEDHPIETGGKQYPPAKEHFYLHYLLARNPPRKDCIGLEAARTPFSEPGETRAPEISCSNSGYP